MTSVLRGWAQAPAILVSCPVPLRRHHAALTLVSQLRLPQCLLGGEAQLLAFAAAEPALAPRLFFSPLPDLHFTPESFAPLWDAVGPPDAQRLPVHLRFGGVRSARVMKQAVNGHVLAEDNGAAPVAPSRHPFAGGLVLPAAMRRLFVWTHATSMPRAIGGAELPQVPVPEAYLSADLRLRPAGRRALPEIVSLEEFRSNAFAAGALRGASADLRRARRARDGIPFVLLPWNLDFPTSAVPALVERLHALRGGGPPGLRPVVYPYNYPGQTGLIRRLIRALRAVTDSQGLADIFVARVGDPAAIAPLRALCPTSWVEGADPEAGWTARRLAAAGFGVTVLARPGWGPSLPGADRVELADEVVLTAESRYGLLHEVAALPAAAQLRDLAAKARRAPRPGAAPAGASRPARRRKAKP